jgi:hypothetical protein
VIWSDQHTVFAGAISVNLVVPSLDENGNPIGRLMGFNSTFIETCRARASLCR